MKVETERGNVDAEAGSSDQQAPVRAEAEQAHERFGALRSAEPGSSAQHAPGEGGLGDIW